MKVFSASFLFKMVFFALSLFILICCSNDYDLDIGDDFYLIKIGVNHHSILKKGYSFYNYGKKGIDLEECLSKNNKDNCYGFISEIMIEPNIVEIGFTCNYIFGNRVNVGREDLDSSFYEKLVPLQPDGYFIINKEFVTVDAGLSREEFVQTMKELGVDHNMMNKIDDRHNMFKALPQMIVNKIRRSQFGRAESSGKIRHGMGGEEGEP